MKIESLYLFLPIFLLIIWSESVVVKAQEPTFELPVELVGFPIIIVAVRLSNLVKKLAYSFNPSTYVSKRSRRSLEDDEMINMIEAEKRLISELGDNVCIYPKVCLHHAEKAQLAGKKQMNIDWKDIFNKYEASKEKLKEYYFLSVFLGDFIASPKFCNQLVHRGRVCKE